MNKLQSFKALLPFRNNLISLFLLSIISTGCQASEQKSEPFLPLINGLATGHYSKDSGCVTINNLSAKLDLDEFEQILQVFSAADCKAGSFRYKKNLSIESQIAGIWNKYIVIDEGTDANGRELHLLSAADKNITHSFYYALMPEFKAKKLSYMMPLEKPAKPEQCDASQQKSLKEWNRLGFELELAEERVFDITNNITVNGSKRMCFPLQ